MRGRFENKVLSPDTNFDTFKNVFDEKFIEDLKRLDKSRKNDSTFILQCLKKLYKNTEQLQMITACGTDGKSTVSLEKRNVIESLFLERLSNQELTQVEITERYIRLNVLINSSINNILRSKVIFFSFHFVQN